jgi:hypothetical protein
VQILKAGLNTVVTDYKKSNCYIVVESGIWLECDVERLKRWIVRKRFEGLSVKSICFQALGWLKNVLLLVEPLSGCVAGRV